MEVSIFSSMHVEFCTVYQHNYFFVFNSVACWLGGESTRAMGKKIFVGRLPQEASAEDLRQYFGRFGRILDVYVPKVN